MRCLPSLITKARPWVPAWREGETIYIDGKPQHRNPLRFYVRALVVPVSGQAEMVLPEGQRLTESYSLYQDPSQTVMADNTDQAMWVPLQVNDKVNLLEGKAFIILRAKDWGSYVEATAQRIDVRGGANIDFPPRTNALD